jgi:hypothetical protein
MKIQNSSQGRFLLVLAAALLLAELTCASVLSPGRAEAATATTIDQYRAWMLDAKNTYHYPQTLDKMYRVMMCESGGNSRASGGGGAWLGLYQYAPTTWRGSWNPYRKSSIWDAKAQIYATAKAWSIGMQGQWSCYYITRGR